MLNVRLNRVGGTCLRHGLAGIRRGMAIFVCLLSLIPLYGLPQQLDVKRNRETERIAPAQREVDSLKVILKNATSETDKAEIYGQLCITYVGVLGEVGIARLYADSIKTLANGL